MIASSSSTRVNPSQIALQLTVVSSLIYIPGELFGKYPRAEVLIRRRILVETTMESTQKPESMAQTMRSKPTLQDDGLSRIQPTSFTPHHPDPSPAETGTIDEWIRDFLEKSSDVDGGIVNKLMELVRCYLKQFELAAVKHQGAVSVLKEHRQNIGLLTDDSKLDQRVAEAPEMQAAIVSYLIALVIVLSRGDFPSSVEKMLLLILHPGTNLVTPEKRQDLHKETEQVIEQVSDIALVHLQRSAGCSPNNILKFLDAENLEIKARIEDLFDLLPETHSLINDLEEIEPRQVQEIGLDQQKSADRYQIFKGAPHQAFSSAFGRFGGASNASYSAVSRRRAHSNLSNYNTTQSSSSTKSPLPPSIFSENGTQCRTHPLAETATSLSVSEAPQSLSELEKSSSIRTPSSRKYCRTPDNK